MAVVCVCSWSRHEKMASPCHILHLTLDVPNWGKNRDEHMSVTSHRRGEKRGYGATSDAGLVIRSLAIMLTFLLCPSPNTPATLGPVSVF